MKHFWKKQVPAFLLALVLVTSLLPVASAKSADITYEVKAGDTVTFDSRDFESFFDVKGATFESVEFYGEGLHSTEGTLYYSNGKHSYDVTDADDFCVSFKSSPNSTALIDDLFFEADRTGRGTVTLNFYANGRDADNKLTYQKGTVDIIIGGSGGSSHRPSTTKADIRYTVEPGKTVDFNRIDFRDYFDENCKKGASLDYVTFYADKTLTTDGDLYYDYNGADEYVFTYRELRDFDFSYSSSGRYPLGDLTYAAAKNAEDTEIVLEFTAEGDIDYVEGVLVIEIVSGKPSTSQKGDVNYDVEPGKTVDFDRADFMDFYDKTCQGDFDYVTFYADRTLDDNGTLYYDYGSRYEETFAYKELKNTDFYYRSSRDYEINYLTYEAGKNADGEVVLVDFTVYGTDTTGSKDRIDSMDGVLAIRIGGSKSPAPVLPKTADIRYFTTSDQPVQINANDIARFFNKSFPKDELQYVTLEKGPSSGLLFYNFYGVSPYGGFQKQITDDNASEQDFRFSPSKSTDYALSELTYVPYGVNYCATIPFTAYGSSKSASVSGNIYISSTLKKVPEVYGVTPKNTAVPFPASALYSAVSNSTGNALAGIQLLALPDPSVGIITTGSGVTLKADTETRYGYSSGTWLMSQLRFTPAKDYTGPVEIPYAAYDSKGNVFAAGNLCLGVVNKIHKFKDITPSTWCYKYVTELADAGIIDGYKDGSFKEKNPLTYGAALKLVMLAAGYPEQAPTVKGSVFSGYLDRAKKDGLVSGKINLTAPITRLEVSRLAAKALKLDIDNLSSVQPFTDTKDPYVQALSAAGIVNGYFDNGTSTFKPNNSLTRGHISAIVWRMNQYRK